MEQGHEGWSCEGWGMLGVGKGPLKIYMAPENGGESPGSLEVPRYWKVPFLGGDLLVLGRVNDFVSLRIQTRPDRVGLMVSIPSPCHRIQSV